MKKVESEIDDRFESCHGWEDLLKAIREILAARGMDSSEKRVRVVLLSVLGGSRVECDASGLPLNKWRRKFYAAEHVKEMDKDKAA